ncbi:MAG: FG-GAP-like repeat-containing protein [Pseudomonadota bacterium]
MDYYGTAGNDLIDQARLALPAGTAIYAGKGDDRITVGDATAIGDEGDDTIIGTSADSTAAYWTSDHGIIANLATGVVSDGFGGTDTLVNLHRLLGSGSDDVMTGSAGNDVFWAYAGSNTVHGGGGDDSVYFWDLKPSDCSISYDAKSDTFTVSKHTANDKGVDTLTGITKLVFSGPGLNDITMVKDEFLPGYLKHYASIDVPFPAVSGTVNVGLNQIIDGDFNGDGKRDILLVNSDRFSDGALPTPMIVMLGDGSGNFIDGTANVFKQIPPLSYVVPRITVADFNGDGIDDIFGANFGVDLPPFLGGQNQLFISHAGVLLNESALLPQRLSLGHGVSVGDVDGDGDLDMLVNSLDNGSGHSTDLYLNDGQGHLVVSNSRLPAALNALGVVKNTMSLIADVNGDGANDLILGTGTSLDGGPSMIYLNDGSGHFLSEKAVALPAAGVDQESVLVIKQIDLNGDKLPDLILSLTNSGEHDVFYATPYMQFLVNDGNGKFHDETQARMPQSLTGTGGWYKFLDLVDLNGDKAPDIVAEVDYTNGQSHPGSVVFLNDGSGHFSELRRFDTGTVIHAMDTNGDGTVEIVTGHAGEFRVYQDDLPRVAHTTPGSAANDRFADQPGNDLFAGQLGVDTVSYTADHSRYSIASEGDIFFVAGQGAGAATDTLMDVERIAFSDVGVALDIHGNGGMVYRLYQAAFNRVPDLGGVGFWIAQKDHGASMHAIAAEFIHSAEFTTLYGANPSATQFIGSLYANVLHRAPDQGGLDFWVTMIKNGGAREDVLAYFGESPENQAQVIGSIEHGFQYTPFGA